jgi:hypothetical protein
LGVFLYHESRPTLGYLFQEKKLSINFDKKWDGLHFGRFFSHTHLVTLATRLSVPAFFLILGILRLVVSQTAFGKNDKNDQSIPDFLYFFLRLKAMH